MGVEVQERAARELVTVHTMANQTVGTENGNSHAVDGAVDTILAHLDATLNSGTGTLDVAIQESFDGSNWTTLQSFTQLSATGRETVVLTRLPGPFVRIQSVVALTADYSGTIQFVGRIALRDLGS